MGNRYVYFSVPASDLGIYLMSNMYLLSNYCISGTVLRSHEIFKEPFFPVLQMRRMSLREIMLSLKFIALENLCSQHHLFLQSLSLPTTESHGTKDHSLLSTNLHAPAGESRQRVKYGSFVLFPISSLLC